MEEKLKAFGKMIADHKSDIIRIGSIVLGAVAGIVVSNLIGNNSSDDDFIDYDEVIAPEDDDDNEEEIDDEEIDEE